MIRIREIVTTTIQVKDPATKQLVDRVVPQLDEQGREIETFACDVPLEIEHEGQDAIDAYVAARRASPAQPDPAGPVPTTDEGEE